MIPIGSKSVFKRKQWLLGLLAVFLLVFQSSVVAHEVDLASHDSDLGCEVCKLLITTGDDSGIIPATAGRIILSLAVIESVLVPAFANANLINECHIRAPPYFA